MREYERFQKGAANSNVSTSVLKRQLEDPTARIIITTIQKLARFVDRAVYPRVDAFQHQPVDLEHVGDVPGVLPVAGNRRRQHFAVVVDHPLDGLSDLKLVPPRRRQVLDRLMHSRREYVNAN